MGSYICKVIGYAIVDLEYDGGDTTDSRINKVLFNDYERLDEVVDDFGDWIETNREEAKSILLEEIGVSTLSGSVFHMNDDNTQARPLSYYPEWGLPNVLLFQPISQSDWLQCRSPVDHYEQVLDSRKEGRALCEVRDVLKEGQINGFYPYDIGMVRYPFRETPEELIEAQTEHVQEGIDSYNLRSGAVDGAYWNSLIWPESEVTPEFREHLLQDWNCVIPPDILLFAHYSGIFTNFETVYTLRPVIYTYWQ